MYDRRTIDAMYVYMYVQFIYKYIYIYIYKLYIHIYIHIFTKPTLNNKFINIKGHKVS